MLRLSYVDESFEKTLRIIANSNSHCIIHAGFLGELLHSREDARRAQEADRSSAVSAGSAPTLSLGLSVSPKALMGLCVWAGDGLCINIQYQIHKR